MNALHAFMLILSIAGQPERAAAICDNYKKCSDQGAAMAVIYAAQSKAPRDFSYRVIPIVIMPEPPTT